MKLKEFKENEETLVNKMKDNFLVETQGDEITLRNRFTGVHTTFPKEIGEQVLAVSAYNHLCWEYDKDSKEVSKYCSDKYYELNHKLFNRQDLSSEERRKVFNFLD